MNLQLTDEQQNWQKQTKAFTEHNIIPSATQSDATQTFDTELISKVGAAGYLGITVPKEYGGLGLDNVTYSLMLEEIGLGCSAVRTVISVQTSLVAWPIEKFGSQQQRDEHLPKLASGQSLGAFALTEPDTGSDAANQQTVATKSSDGWVISGEKKWVSQGSHAELALVFAQTDSSLQHRGLACFIVDCKAKGLTTQKIDGKLGLRGSDTSTMTLDQVAVPDSALLGKVGDGFKIAMQALNAGRLSVAAGCVGICRGSVEASVEYSRNRKQFDRPIASFQLVQAKIAEMVVDTDAARLLVWRAAELKDRGEPNSTETSIAKLFATEASVRCADRAIQIHGGAGYTNDHPVERYLRDARVTTLYEGTSEIQQLIVGKAATGVNAFT